MPLSARVLCSCFSVIALSVVITTDPGVAGRGPASGLDDETNSARYTKGLGSADGVKKRSASTNERKATRQLKNVSGRQAFSIFEQNFSDLWDSDTTPTESRVSGAKIERILNDRTARIKSPQGSKELLLSTIPLQTTNRSQAERVNFDLVSQGKVKRPKNAPLEIEISKELRKGFSIGPESSEAITVTPLGTKLSSTIEKDDDSKLFFSNSYEDTDSLVTATVNGVETFEQIRSDASPITFRYRIETQPGQSMKLERSGLHISRDNRPVVVALPPVAVDSEGNRVPAFYSLNGQVLSVKVDHRSKDYAYPILLDPDWVSTYNWGDAPTTGFEGWQMYEDPMPGGPYYYIATNNPLYTRIGLWIFPIGNSVYPEYAAGKAHFDVPGTTRIRSINWRHVTHINAWDRQALRLALYGSATPQVVDFTAAGVNLNNADIFLQDLSSSSTTAQMWLFTPPCNGAPNCPRYVVAGTPTYAFVGGADLVLTDNDFPTFAVSGSLKDMQNTWSNPTGYKTASITASDWGTGISNYQLWVVDSGGSQLLDTQNVPCNPIHNTPGQGSNICPFQHGKNVSVDSSSFPEGEITFQTKGTDYAGNNSDAGGTTHSWKLYVDRTAPTVQAQGELWEMSDAWTNSEDVVEVVLRADDLDQPPIYVPPLMRDWGLC